MKKRHPLLTVAAKEYRVTYREKVVVLLGLTTWLLLAVAVYTGMERQRQTFAEREQATALFRHEWEDQQANPHSAAHFGTYLFKPATFLSTYDQGLSRYLGVSYRVEAHVRHEASNAEAETADTQLRFGELSVSLVFQLILPLLILMITFDSVTREREGNTLRLVLVQGAGAGVLICGKILGKYAVVLTIVLPALLAMALPVMLQDGSGDDRIRYGLLALAYLVYFLVFTGIGVLISAWSRSAGAALVTCLGVWFLFAILIPRVTTRWVDQQHPLPSRFELNRRIAEGFRNGIDGEGALRDRDRKYLEATLRKYGVDSLSQLPVNFDGLSMQYSEDYQGKVYERFNGEVERLIDQQLGKLGTASLLNPFMAIGQLSMGLAGTDYYHHRAFHRQARQYRDSFIRVLNMELARSGSEYLSYDYQAGPEFFREMDDFVYHPPTVRQAVAWHRTAWWSLGIWCGLTFLLTVIAARGLLRPAS